MCSRTKPARKLCSCDDDEVLYMASNLRWLKSIQQVEQEVAVYCPFICHEVHSGMGSSKNYPISLPSRVSPATLSLILDYCRFHQVPGHSNKEMKSFDEKFIKMDTKDVCELTSAADSLKLKPLVDLTSRALARMIEGRSPEEIRDIFQLPDDLTEEEKLEPIKNTIDDPRIRLLNTLYARKRKVLKEREKLKNVEVEEERVDDRSLEDLLFFINGGESDAKVAKPSKNKKKKNRRKCAKKNTPSNSTSSSSNALKVEESNGSDSTCCDASACDDILNNLGKALKLQGIEDSFAPDHEFDTGDDDIDPTGDDDIDPAGDDDIDPAMKEKIDREVEDFARILSSDWRERMQELLSIGQENGRIPTAINCNGSLRRYARLQK